MTASFRWLFRDGAGWIDSLPVLNIAIFVSLLFVFHCNITLHFVDNVILVIRSRIRTPHATATLYRDDAWMKLLLSSRYIRVPYFLAV